MIVSVDAGIARHDNEVNRVQQIMLMFSENFAEKAPYTVSFDRRPDFR